MGKTRFLAIIGSLTVVAIIASVGIGYALYNGNTYSENNTMPTSVDSVDILVDGGMSYSKLNQSLTIPDYSMGGTATISGYAVATSGMGKVYLTCEMNDPEKGTGSSKYWALIDSMTITFDRDVVVDEVTVLENQPIPFGKVGYDTGVPTGKISMSNSLSTVIDGKTVHYYPFTIEINYSDYDITDDPDFESMSIFAGASFKFVYEPSA